MIAPLVSYDQEAAPSDKSQLDLSGFAMSPQSPWLPDDTLELKELAAPAAVVLLEQLAKPPHKQHSTVEDYALAERFAGLTTVGLTTTYGGLGPASTKLLRPEIRIGVAPLP